MKSPLVSVIIPTFNRHKFIGEALDSVINQTYQNWECIIVDDGSTDNTHMIIKNYVDNESRFFFVKRYRTPKGANTCRNIGIENARGEFIIFLDSDDFLEPFCLERRIYHASKNPKYLLWVYPRRTLNQKTGVIKAQKAISKRSLLEDFFKISPPWQTTAAFSSRSLVLKVGGFDERLPRLQDIDYFTRIIRKFGLGSIKIVNELPDYIRRKFHYNDNSDKIRVKNAIGIWYYYRRNIQYTDDLNRVQRNGLKTLLKILIFDYLSVLHKNHQRILVIIKLSYDFKFIGRWDYLIYLIYHKVVCLDLHHIKGIKYVFRKILLRS